MKLDKNLSSASNGMLVLSILKEKDRYGYEMILELGARSNNVFCFQEGTLYPLLHTLEKKGAVGSYEKVMENGRNRKYYHLTKEGEALLEQKKKEWMLYVKAVADTMEGCAHETAPGF